MADRTLEELRRNMGIVDPATLATRPPFSDLFPIAPATLESVTKSIRDNGFDNSKPINVWRAENVVVDGHTRTKAGIAVGVGVLVHYHDFEDEDEAFEYAVANQRDRRNLTQGDILRLVERVDRRMKGGRPKIDASMEKTRSTDLVSGVPSRERTASIIGISESTVKRARSVLDHASPEDKRAIFDGKAKIRTVDRKISRERKQRKSASPDTPKAEPSPSATGLPSALTPTPEPQQSPRPPAVPSRDPDDAAWLESLSLRSRVVRDRFDDDALIARHIAPKLKAIREELASLVGARSVAGMSLVHRALDDVLTIPPVASWSVCKRCGGSGVDRGQCKSCRGGGYSVPGF